MNFKYFAIAASIAMATANVNAADVSADNLTVSKKLNVSGTSTFNHTVYMDYNPDRGNNFLYCRNRQENPGYSTVFAVSSLGAVSAKSISVSEQTAGHPYCAHMAISWDKNLKSFLLSTDSYSGGPQPRYYSMTFNASSFTFDKGDMTVNGKITCKDELNVTALNAKDINVELNNAADYVFDDNYNLKSLSEVEAYINENKHLPGIPSAAEIAKNGMNVSEMTNMLLEKIEELTLHMIRLEKENAALKAEKKSQND